MTENPYTFDGLNDEQVAERNLQVTRARHLHELPDEQVIAWQPGPSDDRHAMEMTRRLKDATESLTSELVSFRDSSDRAAGKLACLTWVIIGLTVMVALLTAALVVLTLRGTPASPAPAAPRPERSSTPSPSPASASGSHRAG